jgi:hypothetical protein
MNTWSYRSCVRCEEGVPVIDSLCAPCYGHLRVVGRAAMELDTYEWLQKQKEATRS